MKKALPVFAALVALSILLSGCIVINVERKADEKKKPEPGPTPTTEVAPDK